MLTRLLIGLILLLYGLNNYCQPPYLYFKKINTQNGLSHNRVNCILQDKRGFIWIGTNDGLNRYDGRHFINFHHRPGDSTAISGNIITDLLEDENGILWISTSDGGLSRYDHRLSPDRQFKQYRNVPGNPNSIPINIIYDIIQDKKGFLWLATGGHSVIRFDRQKEKFESISTSGTRTALRMMLDENETLWVGRQGGGILKVSTQTLKSESDERYLDLYSKLPHATVTSFFRDSEGHILFGSWDRVLYRINAFNKQEEKFAGGGFYSFPNDEVSGFAEDEKGRIWMGGRYAGLTIFDKKKNHFYNYRYEASREGTIADDQVNCIYRDSSGLIWLGTNKGVSLYDPSQQPFVQTFLPGNFNKNRIYDFFRDDDNDLFIGTDQGIYIQKSSGEIIHRPLKYKGEPIAVTKIFKTGDGKLLIGTNYTLFAYNKNSNLISELPNTDKDAVMNKLIDSRIVSIIEDSIEGRPVILTSPYGHFITYYDPIEKRWVSRTDTVKKIIQRFNLEDNLIRKFYKSSDGQIWLAASRAGLGEWKHASLPRVQWIRNDPSVHGSISNDNVYDIAEDPNGNLWISTYGGGLNFYDRQKKTFIHISCSNNLLEGLAIDDSGNIWLISNGDLHKYNPSTMTYSSYDLPDLEKSGGVEGSVFKDKEGYLYVGGNNYFIRFNPPEINDRIIQPKIYLTDFRVFNNSYSQLMNQRHVSLRHKENDFTFEFSAPEYRSGQVWYSYMLQGWDKDWVDAGDRNTASYSNLSPGSYTFRVRASNKRGVWSEEMAVLSITIKPPYWNKWWFYVLCSMIVAAGIYLLYRYRINELVRRQAIRNEIAQDLHDSVGSTLSSISVYSQVAKIQYERGNNTELKDVLNKIGVTSTDMISEMNDIVWALNPRNDSMQKIFLRMESFAKPLLQTKGIAFCFIYDPSVLNLNLTMVKRKNFYLIFKEAINNVLKYSNCSNIDVKISLVNHQVELSVKDDGQGFDPTKIKTNAMRSLSGNGLYNMKRRAVEMKGVCEIDSAPGKGTTVILRFPIT